MSPILGITPSVYRHAAVANRDGGSAARHGRVKDQSVTGYPRKNGPRIPQGGTG